MKKICNCYTGIEGTIPVEIQNRPGLDALNYRIGTHGSFLSSMKVSLSNLLLDVGDGQKNYPLQALTTREFDDFSIALLDSWALIADILTFYQERIANEGYLRTATERSSIFELARLISYVPKPGVSASVDLAFIMEKGYNAEIPKGTRVQSIPAPGEAAQTFETSEKANARAEWSQIKPRTTRPQSITWEIASDVPEFVIYFQGTATNLNVNQPLLFVFGDQQDRSVLRMIKSVEPQTKEGRTKITLQKINPGPKTLVKKMAATKNGSRVPGKFLSTGPISVDYSPLQAQSSAKMGDTAGRFGRLRKTTSPSDASTQMKHSEVPKDTSGFGIFAFRLTASLFGWNAPPFYISSVDADQKPQFSKPILDPNEKDYELHLDESYYKVLSNSWIAIKWPGVDVDPFIGKIKKTTANISKSLNGIAGKTTYIKLDVPENGSIKVKPSGFTFDNLRETVVYAQSDDLTSKLAEESIDSDIKGKTIELDGYYDNFDAGRKLIVSGIITDDPTIVDMNDAENVEISEVYHGLITRDYGSPAPHLHCSHETLKDNNGNEVKDDQGNTLIHYQLDIINLEDYPKEMFENAIDLPTGGLNSVSLRTWIEIKSFDSKPANNGRNVNWLKSIYSLDSPGDLNQNLEFDLPNTQNPEFIFVELKDRTENTTYISNLCYVNEPTNVLGDLPSPSLVVKEKLKSGSYILAVKNYSVYLKNGYEYFVSIKDESGNGPDLIKTKDLENIPFDVSDKGDSYLVYLTLYQCELTAALQRAEEILALAKLALALKRNLPPKLGDVDPKTEVEKAKASLDQIVLNTPKKFISNIAYTDTLNFLPGDSPHTTLVLSKELEHTYKRDTVTIYANLVRATNGETRNEVVGSGDASLALQQFSLRQFPLTYLAAPIPSGAVSTLEVRINDVLWHEIDSLVGLGRNDRKFITITDEQSKTKVIFGNGREGARPPTGVENIKAVYRSGIGKAGNVKAGQISLLATKPLGLKGVTNPIPASGGSDPETNDQARRNAPLAVTDLDRLVSIRDYEDFALNFAGIGKASAARLPDGLREVIHVSIAGVDDIPIREDSDLFKNLLIALHRASGDPNQPLVLDLCERMLLMISANVRLDPDYVWSSVEPKIRESLLNMFDFEHRESGQDVVLSEVISAIQRVPGVVFVDVDFLDSISETEAANPVETTKKIEGMINKNQSASSSSPDDEQPRPRIIAELARFVKSEYHTIGPVDTLNSIAEQYKTTVDKLKSLNPTAKDLSPTDILSAKLSNLKTLLISPPQLMPAQIAYLSPDIREAVVLKELI